MEHPWRNDHYHHDAPTVSTIRWRAVDWNVAHTEFYNLHIVHIEDFHYRKQFMPNIKSYAGSGGNGDGYDTWEKAFDAGVKLMNQWQAELDNRVQQMKDDNAQADLESNSGI